MGILNATPDSFSDGGMFFGSNSGTLDDSSHAKMEQHLRKLIGDGAAIVDVGGESTKPNAQSIGHEEEWGRIARILEVATVDGKICVSVDTYHLETAKRALVHGANIVNDVCGTWHFLEMASVMRDFDAHLIVVHNARNDENFHKIRDPMAAIISAFEKIFAAATAMDFDVGRIILDPGIGFGKTTGQNLEIFKNIDRLCAKFQNPVVCGTSKKSFLREALDTDARPALAAATIATTCEGFRRGCKIFRVHDVAGNLAALKFAQQLNE
jgi:dihydropteroate synthase